MKNTSICIVVGLVLSVINQVQAFMPQVAVYGPEGSHIAIVATSKCSDLAGQEVKPGTTCTTSQGVEMVRVVDPEAGWKVASDLGKTWFDEVKTGVNHAEAKEFCNRPGFALPTEEDYKTFRTYFAHHESGNFTDEGRKELYAIFPNMEGSVEGKWFWSYTTHPIHFYYAFVFNGNNGETDYYDRDVKVEIYVARCITAPSSGR